MGSDPLEEYLSVVDDAAAPTLRALDAAIRRAAPELESAIKYRMPTYTLDGRWRQWVVALSVTKDAVNLRFLWGVLLEDPLKVLRPGTSTLMTWDFPRGGTVDAAAVASYVREALDKRDAELAALLERFSRFGGPAGLPEREQRPRSAGEAIRRSCAAPRRGRRGAPVRTA